MGCGSATTNLICARCGKLIRNDSGVFWTHAGSFHEECSPANHAGGPGRTIMQQAIDIYHPDRAFIKVENLRLTVDGRKVQLVIDGQPVPRTTDIDVAVHLGEVPRVTVTRLLIGQKAAKE